MAKAAPAFPQPHYNQWDRRTETATHTYNFCISPLTPFGISGIVWIPGKENIPENVAKYAPAMQAWAKSLPGTFGQENVLFGYAQPAVGLVAGIKKPAIADTVSVEFGEWPKQLKEIAEKLGEAVKGR
jgi:hypothetical protein